MNATFPYVTPAISLPTLSPRRPVDAGYYDNYGVSLAADWIMDDRTRKWLEEYTSGVILLQIRAYPLSSSERGGALSWIMNGAQWLSAPFEGYTTVYKRAMLSRNDTKIEALEKQFNTGRLGEPFFEPIVLQCDESAPLSWIISERDRERLRSSLLRNDFEHLINVIRP